MDSVIQAKDEFFASRCQAYTSDASTLASIRLEAPGGPDRFRILLFGDSFTATDSVRNEDRYSDLLEGSLAGTEVYNFGVSGTGTDQQYLIFREEAAGFEYHLLIIAVLVENIRRITARYRPYQDETGATVYYAKPFSELGPGEELVLDALETSEGDLVLTVSAEEDGELVKLQADGSLQCAHRYELPGWHRPQEPVRFVDLDGVQDGRPRQRLTRVVGYSAEVEVARARLDVPVSAHPVDSINLGPGPRHLRAARGASRSMA